MKRLIVKFFILHFLFSIFSCNSKKTEIINFIKFQEFDSTDTITLPNGFLKVVNTINSIEQFDIDTIELIDSNYIWEILTDTIFELEYKLDNKLVKIETKINEQIYHVHGLTMEDRIIINTWKLDELSWTD